MPGEQTGAGGVCRPPRRRTVIDGTRFDAWLRAAAAAPTRRRVLRALAGSALAAVVADRTGEEAAAAPTCPARTGCDARCRNTRKLCACTRTASGNRVCTHPCCSDRPCADGGDCRAGEVCLKTDCCGGPVCVTKCSEPRPAYCGRSGATAATAGAAAWGATPA
ncbi:MAG: hypothetical protein AVDCRST_MAG19-4486 [uncultured Thermomicrobiales bacterium]|uniref:Uncharacterized protein n=1 Tax=uncultured Thermomicrobiales bacterium TaxID=1645740 RepID=A0A6J4VQD7_9BACT|nr:MAG: hypothetical protein AVDCRST_MAG19-4486 [uncultured Thermomicrobiales bacterium]